MDVTIIRVPTINETHPDGNRAARRAKKRKALSTPNTKDTE